MKVQGRGRQKNKRTWTVFQSKPSFCHSPPSVRYPIWVPSQSVQDPPLTFSPVFYLHVNNKAPSASVSFPNNYGSFPEPSATLSCHPSAWAEPLKFHSEGRSFHFCVSFDVDCSIKPKLSHERRSRTDDESETSRPPKVWTRESASNANQQSPMTSQKRSGPSYFLRCSYRFLHLSKQLSFSCLCVLFGSRRSKGTSCEMGNFVIHCTTRGNVSVPAGNISLWGL